MGAVPFTMVIAQISVSGCNSMYHADRECGPLRGLSDAEPLRMLTTDLIDDAEKVVLMIRMSQDKPAVLSMIKQPLHQ